LTSGHDHNHSQTPFGNSPLAAVAMLCRRSAAPLYK